MATTWTTFRSPRTRFPHRFAEQVLTSLAVLQLVDAGRVSLDDLHLMFDPYRM
jgi:hypothetical protein